MITGFNFIYSRTDKVILYLTILGTVVNIIHTKLALSATFTVVLLAVGTLLISSFCFTWLTIERQGTHSLVPTLQLLISLLPCFHTWSIALGTENDKLKMGSLTIIHNCLGKGSKIKSIIFAEFS